MTDLIDTTEMYLRTIFELEEEGIPALRARIAERLGHSGPTVSQTIARMERDGLVSLAGDRHLELSEEGRILATRVMRKHRLAERLLVDVIGLDWEYVHDEACRWEHVISERVERRLVELLPEHRVSPYGNPIPGLEELGVESADSSLMGLGTLAAFATDDGARVRIERIGEPVQVEPDSLALLTETGLRPGAEVTVRRDGSRVVASVEGGGPGASLPDEVAMHVFARRL
ncbi:iron dependent repressor, metal binding and dimerization domain protein [Actinomycetota bacterium]